MPDYRLATRRAARQFGVNPNILLRLIQQESGFNPNARSPAGAQGIAQFMPATAKAYGVNLNDNRVTDDLQGAARYLAANLRRTGGNYAQALSIYNSGSPTGYQRIPETRNYVRSILGGAAPEAPRRSGGVGPGVQGSLTISPGTAPGFDAGNGASDPSVLAGLLAQPQAPPALQVQAPNSALKYLTGSGNVPVVQAPAPREDVGALAGLLKPAEGLPEVQGQAPRVSVNVSGSGPTASAASVASGSYPTARTGKIIGTPYTGTHTLGNWQSDNAVDIAVPIGTPMVALQNGVVVKVRHHPQGAGRFAGDQITFRGANGNQYFYAHGVAHVRPGQHLRKGQTLGTTGSANGVAHLHFGQMRGDPRMHVGGR